MRWLFIVFIVLPALLQAQTPDCHYTPTIWNTLKKTSLTGKRISKFKTDLTAVEQGPWGCTLCEEDQTIITLSNQLQVQLCKNIAPKAQKALNDSLNAGAEIKTIKGYRPSRSRGPLNQKGQRTQYSNHAYGVALDINEKHNGLYNNCSQWPKNCKLSKGGAYRPHQSPLSFTKSHSVVQNLQKQGWMWGGEITGPLKDFMHFSPDGR